MLLNRQRRQPVYHPSRRFQCDDDDDGWTTMVISSPPSFPADRIAVARAVLTNGWLWRSLLGVEFVSVYKRALQPKSYLLPNDLWIEY